MSRPRALSLAAIVAACALLACGQVATSGAASADANRAAAHTEATRLLSLVALPPGTTGSPTEPSGDGGALAEQGLQLGGANLVDTSAWWTTSTSPDAVLAYVREHRPAGARPWSWSAGSGNGVQFMSFMLPPIAGVLSQRGVEVTVTRLQNGLTGVRTDGEAVWLIPRPAWEQIPSTVRTVTFTARGSNRFGRPGRESAPVTLRGTSAQRFTAFVNDLQIVQPGARACPEGRFGWVRMIFRAADGSVLARATEQPSGCAFVALTVGGRSGPALNDYPTVTSELIRLGAIPVCMGAQLRATVGVPTFDPSGRVVSLTFSNRSNAVCRLAGSPRLRAFDARGRRLALTVRRSAPGETIPLDPGQAASTLLTWRQCRSPRASRMRVTLPGVRPAFTVSVGSRANPVAPCRGRISVSSLMQEF